MTDCIRININFVTEDESLKQHFNILVLKQVTLNKNLN